MIRIHDSWIPTLRIGLFDSFSQNDSFVLTCDFFPNSLSLCDLFFSNTIRIHLWFSHKIDLILKCNLFYSWLINFHMQFPLTRPYTLISTHYDCHYFKRQYLILLQINTQYIFHYFPDLSVNFLLLFKAQTFLYIRTSHSVINFSF